MYEIDFEVLLVTFSNIIIDKICNALPETHNARLHDSQVARMF